MPRVGVHRVFYIEMSKGTKTFGHSKALAWESQGFVIFFEGNVLTHPLEK